MKPDLHHIVRSLRDHLPHQLHGHGPRLAAGVLAAAAGAGLTTWLILRSRRPSAAELERRRRDHLAAFGRITDGVLLDAHTLSGYDTNSPTPEVLVYSYRVAGVIYNCAQDVSLFPALVAGFRLDQAIQVRYDPRNPGNSILLAEDWTGLWQTREALHAT